MTPEQQQVAIAEACGDKTGYRDYLNDLNSIHEAEKTLTVAQRITYANQIGVVLSGGSVGRAIPNWWFIHEATASQRAEAFLRTVGKWEESK